MPPPTWSGGPCPSCPGTGALLILRRAFDARLLFHCPRCGLAFTHEETGKEPEYAKSLEDLAPGGTRPATESEIRGAELWEHATPWTDPAPAPPPPPPPPPKVDPAKVHLLHAPPPARRPFSALGSRRPSGGSNAAKAVGGGAILFIIIKIIVFSLMHSSHR